MLLLSFTLATLCAGYKSWDLPIKWYFNLRHRTLMQAPLVSTESKKTILVVIKMEYFCILGSLLWYFSLIIFSSSVRWYYSPKWVFCLWIFPNSSIKEFHTILWVYQKTKSTAKFSLNFFSLEKLVQNRDNDNFICNFLKGYIKYEEEKHLSIIFDFHY